MIVNHIQYNPNISYINAQTRKNTPQRQILSSTTPLAGTVQNTSFGNKRFAQALADGNLKKIQRILHFPFTNKSKLLNRTRYSETNETALMKAISDGNIELAKLLLSQPDIDVNLQDRDGNSSSRVVNPYCMVLKDGVWYLYAYCTLKNEFRLFKCSRISSFSKTGKHFEPKNINLNDKPWLSGGFSEINICLEINPSVLPDFYDWLGSNFSLKTENGHNIISFKALSNSGLISRLITFGDKIKVLSPSSIATSLASYCSKISRLYAL